MALLYEKETYEIRGAVFEVYKDKGSGFLEIGYHECLQIELGLQNIPHTNKPKLKLAYKGVTLQTGYEPDFICFEKIGILAKAVAALSDVHRAQVHNYLKATGLRLGLPINFGNTPQVEIERIVR